MSQSQHITTQLPDLTNRMSLGSEDEMNDNTENQPPNRSTSKSTSKSASKSTSKSQARKRKSKKSQPRLMEDLEQSVDHRIFQSSGVNEGGTLIAVRLVDFMSHKNFAFPSKAENLKAISFICGPNGSGKSAILMAMRLQISTNIQTV